MIRTNSPNFVPQASVRGVKKAHCALIYVLPALLGILPLAAKGQQEAPAAPVAIQTNLGNSIGDSHVFPTFPSFAPGSAYLTDLIFGRNVKGPYPLSWKGIRINSEDVVRDGARLRRDDDYTVDAVKGSITFTVPLRSDQLVRILYSNDTPDAAPNTTTAATPLQMDLWRQGQNRLTFGVSARANPNPNAAATSATTTLQFLGGTRLRKGSDLNSGLYLDLQGGDWLGKSGLNLSEKTQMRSADFALAYKRAGTQFQQEAASGLKAGSEIMEATGALHPLHGLNINTTLRQTALLADSSKPDATAGPLTREFNQSLDYTLPKNGGKILAGRLESTITAPNAEPVTNTSDTLKFDRALSKTTQATLGYESLSSVTKSDGKETGTYTQKTGIGITTKPSSRLSVTGNFENATGTTPQDTVGLMLDAFPFAKWKTLRFKANWQDQFQADGVRRNREARVELPALAWGKTQITGGVQQTSSPAQARLIGLLDANTTPLRYLQITTGARFREGSLTAGASDPDAVDTYNLKMALAAWKRVKLTGNLAWNPENADGSIRRAQAQAVGLETQFGKYQFQGQLGTEDETLTARQLNTLNFTFGVQLTRWDLLTTGYRDSSTFDGGLAGSADYLITYTRKLGALFDMSLSSTVTRYTNSDITQPDKTDVKAEAKLNLRF